MDGNGRDVSMTEEPATKAALLPSTMKPESSPKPGLSPQQVVEKRTASFPQQAATATTSDGEVGAPTAKRMKSEAVSASIDRESQTPTSSILPKTPDIAAEESDFPSSGVSQRHDDVGSAPMQHFNREHSSGSVSSDLSSASAATAERQYTSAAAKVDRCETLSPIPTACQQEGPPAPPSTPASLTSVFSWDASMTPLPTLRAGVMNASFLEQQQLVAEGEATPAPTRPDASDSPKPPVLSEDFSDWAVGDRYRMMRILGRGSYGEVAQAVDLYAGRPDAYVAIKRIQSPFDQEVDAIRLYREIHILRRMRGHQCIIQLLDVVQPPTDDLDDFHDLYLVFECECTAEIHESQLQT
jgi:hypothetical protein